MGAGAIVLIAFGIAAVAWLSPKKPDDLETPTAATPAPTTNAPDPSGPIALSAGTCEQPTELRFGAPIRDTTLGRTSKLQAECADEDAPEQVFRFEVQQMARADFLVEASYDSAIYLTRGCGTSQQVLACNDVADADTTRSRITLALEPGTYFLIVDGYGDEAGAFSLTASLQPFDQTGSTCESASQLRSGERVDGTTEGLSDDRALSCASDSGTGPDRHFTLHVGSRARLRVSLQSDEDTALGLLASCAGPELACNDDFVDTSGSQISAVVDPGDYVVVVDGWDSSDVGRFNVQADWVDVAGAGEVGGDRCDSAPPLGASGGTVDTVRARDDYAGSCGGQGGADVVRTLTVPRRSRVQLHISQAEFNGAIFVRRTCDGPDLACQLFPSFQLSDAPTAVETVLDAGQYFIIVDGLGESDFGRVGINVQLLPEA